MQRMFNLRKWSTLTEGTALSWSSKRPRVVKFEVNSPAEVSLHLRYPDGVFYQEPAGYDGEAGTVHEIVAPGTTFFLALVRGRDTIETFVDANFEVLSEGGGCYVYTADGDDVHSVVLEPVIFTRIAERKARNPEIEAIERRMYLNQQRRLDQQLADMERRYGAVLSAAEERAVHAEKRAREAGKPAAESVKQAVGGSEPEADKSSSGTDAGAASGDKPNAGSGETSSGKAGKSGKG